jgi:methionyl-tRNA formyltransferase
VRTVFLGTSEFAAAVLERLASSAHAPVLVGSRPDRPRGRGRRLTPPPVVETASALGIAVIQPESVNDEPARDQIAAAAPDALIVCAFGALIKEPLLSAHPILNVHPSLLPRWRGAAPVERAIMAGEGSSGVSIMRLTAGLDSGPVCLQQEVPIEPRDTYATLAERLQTIGAELLVRALDESPPCTEQDDAAATYAEKIRPEDRRLDPSLPAAELERRVRALTPHIGAYAELADGSRLGVSRARVVSPELSPPVGTVALEGSNPVLGCADGALELLLVQPPGKRPMSGADYLRGLR